MASGHCMAQWVQGPRGAQMWACLGLDTSFHGPQERADLSYLHSMFFTSSDSKDPGLGCHQCTELSPPSPFRGSLPTSPGGGGWGGAGGGWAGSRHSPLLCLPQHLQQCPQHPQCPRPAPLPCLCLQLGGGHVLLPSHVPGSPPCLPPLPQVHQHLKTHLPAGNSLFGAPHAYSVSLPGIGPTTPFHSITVTVPQLHRAPGSATLHTHIQCSRVQLSNAFFPPQASMPFEKSVQ